MRRREFITSLAGAAAARPFTARAQQSEPVRRIGVLMAVAETDPMGQPWITALQQRLETLGWRVGRNLRIDYRWAAGNLERMHTMAAELVSLNPNVLLAGNNPTAAALQQATRDKAIVFVLVAEPIASGFVTSLAHPNGNMTGFISSEGEMVGKRLELLKEIAPGVRRVAVMFDPAVGRYTTLWLRVAEASAPSMGLDIVQFPIHNADQIETALNVWGREGATAGLSVIPDLTTLNNRSLIADLAARHRLPSVWAYRFFALSGGLISYGPDITEAYRQGAQYIDQILRGADAGDLPVQVPTKYEMVINLKTARVIDLQISATLLQRADEVIE